MLETAVCTAHRLLQLLPGVQRGRLSERAATTKLVLQEGSEFSQDHY